MRVVPAGAVEEPSGGGDKKGEHGDLADPHNGAASAPAGLPSAGRDPGSAQDGETGVAIANASEQAMPAPRVDPARIWVTLAAAVLASGWAAYRLWILPQRPGVRTALGYYGFLDQRFYLGEARALASGQLPHGHHYLFGLGYPIFGALALKLGFHGDPFAPVDVLAFGAEIGLAVLVGARLRSLGFGLVAALALAAATPLIASTLVPWSTTVVAVAVLAVLAVATSPSRLRWWHGLLLALCVGLSFAARYVDVVGPAVIALLALGRPRSRCSRSAIVAAVLGTALITGAVFATQAVAFGNPFRTPYAQHLRAGFGSDQSGKSYDIAWIPRDAAEVFITGRSNCNHGTPCPEGLKPGQLEKTEPLVAQFPLIVFVPIGLLAMWRRRQAIPDARLIAGATAASVAMSLFYLSFVAGGGAGLDYGSLRHYAAWCALWSLLGLYGALSLVDLLRGFARRRWATRSLA